MKFEKLKFQQNSYLFKFELIRNYEQILNFEQILILTNSKFKKITKM
jgi:hypothetical protein